MGIVVLILFSHSVPDMSSRKLMLKSCKDWLVDNNLSLHLGKTESILFGPKIKLYNVNVDDLSIECDSI